MKRFYYIIICISFTLSVSGQIKDIEQMTKEDVLNITYDELLDMPFEDVLKLADIVGVSMDELYEMLLNKDVVSASKKIESSFESPLSTSVISHDEILISGARSVEEALRLVPGLIVREKTNGNFDVHIRGNDNLPARNMLLYSENSNTLVMIDNRPVFNYVHGGSFWETLPIGLDDIDRIEVVRGPSSALYGPNAVSGVINIITKKQDSKKLTVDANAMVGTQSSIISSLAIGKSFNENFALRVSGFFETMDRNTDQIYVYLADDGQGAFISKDELAVLKNPEDTSFYVFDPADNVDDMYPNPSLARRRGGANAYLSYNAKKDIYFDLKGGYQFSEVLSSTMGDNPSSFAGRLSNTYYTDFNTQIYGLKGQVNYLGGVQDVVRQDTGFKVDMQNINANLEYDFNVGNLNIRPGAFYQLNSYNDMPYLRYDGQGFLNGSKDFTTMALSLRMDYMAFEKLRLIGALRGEKYSTNDEMHLSYQAIASYNINDKHLIRGVVSKANRSPFLVDTYANYLWNREGRPSPSYIYFEGNEDMDLLTMNMYELGYRIKPTKKIQADFEIFYTQTDNFSALYPDSVNLFTTGLSGSNPWVRMTYQNLDLKTKQVGLSGEIVWVAMKDLYIKVFGTYQKTKLTDYIPYTLEQTTSKMFELAYFSYLTSYDVSDAYSTSFPALREDGENKATPSFYGGLVINYQFIEKFNINVNSYYYSAQEFNSKYNLIDDDSGFNIPEKIESKIILNSKISYEIKPQAIVYLNLKNLLGSKTEFAYMDKIGLTVSAGFTLKL